MKRKGMGRGNIGKLGVNIKQVSGPPASENEFICLDDPIVYLCTIYVKKTGKKILQMTYTTVFSGNYEFESLKKALNGKIYELRLSFNDKPEKDFWWTK